jgi:hypothetical protein
MTKQTAQQQQYTVSLCESEQAAGELIFAFVPQGVPQENNSGALPKRAPQFIVAVHREADGLVFDWSGTTNDPGTARDEIEAEVSARIEDREVWLDRVNELVDRVEQWAAELGWSTRRIVKKLDDARIGKHHVPALLMQEDTYRILLEPIGRSTPGTEGVVDLYLMPAYDDIASLYYYGGQWKLHYMFSGKTPAPAVSEADAVPLTKDTLEKVLAELRQHAA